MDSDHPISRLLIVFSHMVEMNLARESDQHALALFLDLLRKDDPLILLTKDGPLFLALARRFGLVKGARVDQGRLYNEDLPAAEALEVITRWESIQAALRQLGDGPNFLSPKSLGGKALPALDATTERAPV